MNRRAFLATTAAGAAVAAFPAILKAQGGDTIKVGFPGPTTGPFGALAKDHQQGASVAMEEINAKGGILGRRLEILFRDDQLKPAVGAQRTKELIENERCEFIVGGLAAHVQMAISEPFMQAGVLFISVSQSGESTARRDWGPLTFHEALNPTITSRAVGNWLAQNRGKKWWLLCADYAWGKQNSAVLTEVLKRQGGVLLGWTPYPRGNPEFSAHLPKILAAKREVLVTMTPGADNIAFLKQAISFGMKKEMKIAQPLHWLPQLKEGGPDLYADIYAGINFSWQLEDAIPEAKNYVALYRKKHNEPPGDYSAYAYSAIHEVARVRSQGVPGSLDREGAGAIEDEGGVGLRRHRAEGRGQRGAGPVLQGEGLRLAHGRADAGDAGRPSLHGARARDDFSLAGDRLEPHLLADDRGEL